MLIDRFQMKYPSQIFQKKWVWSQYHCANEHAALLDQVYKKFHHWKRSEIKNDCTKKE